MDHGEGGVRFRASVGGFQGRAECSWDPLNKSPRPSHPRNGRMTALPFAVNSAAIDSKCRLVLHPVLCVARLRLELIQRRFMGAGTTFPT